MSLISTIGKWVLTVSLILCATSDSYCSIAVRSKEISFKFAPKLALPSLSPKFVKIRFLKLSLTWSPGLKCILNKLSSFVPNSRGVFIPIGFLTIVGSDILLSVTKMPELLKLNLACDTLTSWSIYIYYSPKIFVDFIASISPVGNSVISVKVPNKRDISAAVKSKPAASIVVFKVS